ncbi:tRNA-dihydrouridine synthase [Halogeometricum limi]|uniref:TIM-barrel protein, putative n=1 Tax=Halogeometricum limi TaxID=555875 RepID=A0A1I6I4R4_9EURY|nr:tRNA-dihydrouridine synthase [Halogeometricum limi]SFR61380.1 TIM-barrel protein, putative [Halogeometricum limi]
MFEPRVALASLSGEADAAWARRGAPYAGMAFLGGVSLDDESRRAARELVARDRNEFLPEDPFAFVHAELSTLADASADADADADATIAAGVNVRSATLDPIRRAAAVCAAHDAVLEVNAHCRQAELCAVGCGETLLRDTERLCEYVAAAADEGATVSVKVRAEVDGVDLADTARRVADAGAAMLHVDAMDSESVVADLCDTPLFVVANNGVRDEESVREYLGYGADAVSVGRPSTDPRVLRRVRRAADDWFAERTPSATDEVVES